MLPLVPVVTMLAAYKVLVTMALPPTPKLAVVLAVVKLAGAAVLAPMAKLSAYPPDITALAVEKLLMLPVVMLPLVAFIVPAYQLSTLPVVAVMLLMADM